MAQIILNSIAIAFAAVYSFFLLGKRYRSVPSTFLVCAITAVAALELFDLMTFLYPENLGFWKKCSILAEGCLAPSWFLFSLTYAREVEPHSISTLQRFVLGFSFIFPIVALGLPTSSFFYSPDFSAEHVLFLGNTGYLFYTGILVFMIISLVNLETTLGNSSHGSRWKIKLEILGSISLLAVLLFYYSQGLLYRTINMNFVPLRSLVVIFAVALMAYSRLKRGGGVKIYVSKQMAFKSVVLLAVGIYLVGLGLMGEGMNYFGESFQRSMVIAVAFLIGLGMVIVFLSETVKRKIKVFLHRNFYQQKYDYRAQWLQFTGRLASSRTGDDLLKSIVSGFSEVFGMGCGALFLLDGDRRAYYIAAELEMEYADIIFKSREPFATFISERRSPVNMHADGPGFEAGRNDFFTGNAVSFIIPLILNGSMEGFIVLGRPLNKDEIYNYEDYDLMTTLASQAMSAILNLSLSDELSRAKELEAMGRLSAFIMHDLKNLVSTIALVVDNAREFMGDPEFQEDMLQTLGNTVTKIKGLIAKLKKLEEKTFLRCEPSDLLEIAGSVAGCIGTEDVRVYGESVISEVDAEEIRKLLLNLILNGIDATGGKGGVSVEVGCDDSAFIRVRDEGCGMSEDFVHKHLFKPFRTTKEKGLGIGLYQCKQIVDAHGGRIEVNSKEGVGTTFTVRLPLYAGHGSQANVL